MKEWPNRAARQSALVFCIRAYASNAHQPFNSVTNDMNACLCTACACWMVLTVGQDSRDAKQVVLAAMLLKQVKFTCCTSLVGKGAVTHRDGSACTTMGPLAAAAGT